MGGQNHRRIVLSNGAHTIVQSLRRIGIQCILVADIAAHFLGNGSVPKDIKVVVMPSFEGSISKEKVATLLMEDNPVAFRLRHRKDKPSVLSYFDSVVQPPKKTWCDVELITIHNPPPPEYTAEHVMHVDGLPVGSMLPLVIEKIRKLFLVYNLNDGNLPPSNLNRFKKLLTKLSINWIHGHESFRQEAMRNLSQASVIFPELAPQLLPLIDECQRASMMLQTSSERRAVDSSILRISNVNRMEARTPQAIPLKKSPTANLDPVSIRGSERTTNSSEDHTTSRTEALCKIAKQVVDVVRQTGVECALFGSLACYLYGNVRPPNDIDLIVFPGSQEPFDAEVAKRNIAERDPINFRLEAPKDPNATYTVLYFVVGGNMAPANSFHKNKCKIDILVPGLLHLPVLGSNHIKCLGGLPVIPFPLLLLQKLQGWDDHLHMTEPYKFQKHVTDAADVHCLLNLQHVVCLRFARPWDNHALFSREFMVLSRQRVLDFCRFYPDSAPEWSRLGFDTRY